MGAWSHEPFGNDESVLARVFNRAIENQKDYLEADEASVIVATAEVLAKLLGKGTQDNASTAS